MIDIPYEANSSDKRLSGDDYGEFEVDGIRDQEYNGIKNIINSK